MKKIVKISIVVFIIFLLIMVLRFFVKQNNKGNEIFETTTARIETIVKNTVATGKVNPEEEVEIKPQITGIVSEILVEEGDQVQKGQVIAKIRVVPNAQALAQANNQVKLAEYRFQNAEFLYERNKELLENKAISLQNFQNTELEYFQAEQNLKQANRDYQITKKGYAKGAGNQDNTIIKAEISGTVLEIPLREGDQVIQANNFNSGTTIATIADMTKMIFEGKIDESEVEKLTEGQEIYITLGAIGTQKFPALLTFIAPKGIETNGAVQFTMKAKVNIENIQNIRAGYSANAIIELDRRTDVLAIEEALLQFDEQTGKPFLELAKNDDLYERQEVVLGLSDGIYVEILEGITQEDEIKIWNALEPRVDVN